MLRELCNLNFTKSRETVMKTFNCVFRFHITNHYCVTSAMGNMKIGSTCRTLGVSDHNNAETKIFIYQFKQTIKQDDA